MHKKNILDKKKQRLLEEIRSGKHAIAKCICGETVSIKISKMKKMKGLCLNCGQYTYYLNFGTKGNPNLYFLEFGDDLAFNIKERI